MLKTILGILAACVFGIGVGYFYNPNIFSSELPPEKHRLIGLKKQIDKINQRTPIVIDGFLLLDHVWVWDGAKSNIIAKNLMIHNPKLSDDGEYSVEPKIQYTFYIADEAVSIVQKDRYGHGEMCGDVMRAYFNKEGYAIETIYKSLDDEIVKSFTIPAGKCRIM